MRKAPAVDAGAFRHCGDRDQIRKWTPAAMISVQTTKLTVMVARTALAGDMRNLIEKPRPDGTDPLHTLF